jgi:DNA-binding transcriptional LysR family regulator
LPRSRSVCRPARRLADPDVALSLLDLEPSDGYGLVISGDLDLLITHRYPGVALPDPRGLHRQLLLHDPLRIVLPADHPKARSPRLSVTDLTDQEWISGGVGEPNRVSLELAARSAGSRPHIAYETRDYQVTLALIEAGLGIALVPASVLGHTSRPGIAFRPVQDWPWPARSTWYTANGRQDWSPTSKR